MHILGLDPGLQTTGWGIISFQNNSLKPIAQGLVKTTASFSLAARLNQLHEGLSSVLDRYKPDEAAVEKTFVNQNPSSALLLGMARGVVLLTPASRGITVGEYSATHIKKAVVGVGHASKGQVIAMMQRLLPTCVALTADEADALAVAVCHAHTVTTQTRWHPASAS